MAEREPKSWSNLVSVHNHLIVTKFAIQAPVDYTRNVMLINSVKTYACACCGTPEGETA